MMVKAAVPYCVINISLTHPSVLSILRPSRNNFLSNLYAISVRTTGCPR
jgi:hypothetical protein